MPIIPNFRILLGNPTLSNLFLVRQNPSFFLRLASSIMEPSKVVAEYAKSARSSCKKCDKKIDANALRLGSESKDNPADSDAEDADADADADDDNDVDDTKDADEAAHVEEDALENQYHGIVRQSMSSVLRAPVTIMMLLVHQNPYKRKLVTMQCAIGDKDAVREKENDENNDLEDRKSKKGKLSTTTEGAELDISLSTSDIPLKYKVVAEYAKSARSSCKKCDKKIENAALRVLLETKMQLKDPKTEFLRDQRQTLVREKDDDENNDLEDRKSKKGKLSTTTEGAELDVSFSTSDIPLKYKVVAEYAKSARSSCKKCDKKIDTNTLRLGSVTRDKRRGFDMTKWHHLDFHQNPYKHKLVTMQGAIGDKDAVKGTKERIPKRSKVREKDDDKNNDLEDRKSKKGKLSTTTEGAKLDVSFSISDIQLKYKDATLLPKWKAFRTVIFLEQVRCITNEWYLTLQVVIGLVKHKDEGLQDSGKIAAFDFDGCLVNTNVKKVGPDAWSLMYPSIPEKLQSLYNEGYKLVIFTNESNIDRWKNKRQVAVDSKIGRLTNFIKHVNVPMQVFIACGIGKSGGQTEDPFRKPNPGMWHLMDWHFNSGISIDMDQSFYVGDAAGRENDHSDADIKFAEAVGLKFYVPEEYFEV
ncbi:hypothetical protein RHGRI_018323 [Rhododendron griersonianum]|uniref:PARP-type domain-containing protein n=1 Tax=Rhododendron griersonianum TaxID=479676 RepID=A0AAV6K0Z2_9ERIC|nr:hypothetical protein RHGRI_018323 [Rhododendron griersonianum]